MVRSLRAHKGADADAALWVSDVSREYRKLLMAGAVGKTEERTTRKGKVIVKVRRRGISKEESAAGLADSGDIPLVECKIEIDARSIGRGCPVSGQRNVSLLRDAATTPRTTAISHLESDIPLGKMLRCRIRYFTDGAVIGSQLFVDEAFLAARGYFGPKRKSGARKMMGDAEAAAAAAEV